MGGPLRAPRSKSFTRNEIKAQPQPFNVNYWIHPVISGSWSNIFVGPWTGVRTRQDLQCVAERSKKAGESHGIRSSLDLGPLGESFLYSRSLLFINLGRRYRLQHCFWTWSRWFGGIHLNDRNRTQSAVHVFYQFGPNPVWKVSRWGLHIKGCCGRVTWIRQIPGFFG